MLAYGMSFSITDICTCLSPLGLGKATGLEKKFKLNMSDMDMLKTLLFNKNKIDKEKLKNTIKANSEDIIFSVSGMSIIVAVAKDVMEEKNLSESDVITMVRKAIDPIVKKSITEAFVAERCDFFDVEI
ncbi:MAG: hypothetical protein RR620_08840 [Clostridium sp.]